MFAVCDDSGTWWYTEATEGESFEETAEESAEPAAASAEESVLVLRSVLSPFLPGVAKESKEFMSPINKTAPLVDQSWEIKELYDCDWSLVTSSFMHDQDGDSEKAHHQDHLSVLLSINKASVDSGFWLLDSGASMNVITKEALQHFQHTEVQSFANPMQAANGSDVAMEGFCKVLLEIQVIDPKGDKRTGVIPIDVLVGQTAFCILSTCKLGRLGWKTTVGKHGVDITHEKTGVRATDVSIWHDTPWVLVKSYLGNDVKFEPPVLSAVIGDMVFVLTPDEMAAHRPRGHIPFEPSCEACINTGVGSRTKGLSLRFTPTLLSSVRGWKLAQKNRLLPTRFWS